MPRQLVWLRNDLRLEDNLALFKASQQGEVLAVFVYSPQQWQAHSWGHLKTAFVLSNLYALQKQLATLNIPLKLLSVADFNATPAALLQLAQELGISGLFFNDEYEFNEQKRDAAVVAAFNQAGIKVERFTDQVIFEPGSIRTGKGDFYTVFTPFYRNWISKLRPEHLVPLPAPAAQAASNLASDALPEFTAYQQLKLWPAGEAAAHQKLQTFCEEVLNLYDQQRDFPAIEGTSQISAYLAAGVISSRQCIAAAQFHSADRFMDKSTGAGVWVSELVWREFYRHLLIGFPRISKGRAFKPTTEKLAWRSLENSKAQRDLEAWKAGKTGFPIIDAAMRQLLETGWMHNRLRMLVAMFLSKNLLIDWRVGEAFFMQHLIDGDLAANNGGWQWAASTGTDAVPYFRLFNPYSQSQRFDPEGKFIRRYVPELAHLNNKDIHQPPVNKLGMDKLGGDLFGNSDELKNQAYPAPIMDLKLSRDRVMQAFEAIK
ncbi:deoxyribodipyrimidine photo-lyase [Marinospirillum insulare]|uniref:Deoxyribodipyrimidine photo-lyase n=1 Tax=Marinospirillum insulare TaxID=217169 RepID=A0ABQ5ZXG2_9GAMM|nr:deoxyribodipyrimidine photo-lyase [Marinospirillum insulare]GLR64166.1 deoxyribodipyrimidine photo-lyase [Marinospirillum insulare]